MTNGEKIQQDFECEVCEPIIEDNIIHVIFAEKLHSAIGFDLDWWNAEYKEPNSDIRLNRVENELNQNKNELEPTTKNETLVSLGAYKQVAFERDIAVEQLKELGYQLGEKVRKADDCISRAEVLKAMDTWDKFGYTETGCFVREPKGDYVPYVHYEDMVNCVKGMPSVTPQEPTNDLGVDAIARAEVNRVIEDYMDEQYHVLSDRTRERAFGAKVVLARINELQPVTLIRPKGHWIKIGDRGFGYSDIVICKCSECEYQTEFVGKFDGHNLVIDAERADNYCSNCGSDNREVVDE